jgi:hypothetical protein
MSPRPPDILRKSHRHGERKERAAAKDELRREVSAAAEEVESAAVYIGSCSCGAVGYRYFTALLPGEWSVRACQCSFCRRHGAVCASDPNGSVEIVADEPAALERYRSGFETADFLLCRRCGDYLAAVITTEHGERATVNLERLVEPPPELPAPRPVSYAAETREDRIRRREALWTPVRA